MLLIKLYLSFFYIIFPTNNDNFDSLCNGDIDEPFKQKSFFNKNIKIFITTLFIGSFLWYIHNFLEKNKKKKNNSNNEKKIQEDKKKLNDIKNFVDEKINELKTLKNHKNT